jgi:hypothetical protein
VEGNSVCIAFLTPWSLSAWGSLLAGSDVPVRASLGWRARPRCQPEFGRFFIVAAAETSPKTGALFLACALALENPRVGWDGMEWEVK